MRTSLKTNGTAGKEIQATMAGVDKDTDTSFRERYRDATIGIVQELKRKFQSNDGLEVCLSPSRMVLSEIRDCAGGIKLAARQLKD